MGRLLNWLLRVSGSKVNDGIVLLVDGILPYPSSRLSSNGLFWFVEHLQKERRPEAMPAAVGGSTSVFNCQGVPHTNVSYPQITEGGECKNGNEQLASKVPYNQLPKKNAVFSRLSFYSSLWKKKLYFILHYQKALYGKTGLHRSLTPLYNRIDAH